MIGALSPSARLRLRTSRRFIPPARIFSRNSSTLLRFRVKTPSSVRTTDVHSVIGFEEFGSFACSERQPRQLCITQVIVLMLVGAGNEASTGTHGLRHWLSLGEERNGRARAATAESLIVRICRSSPPPGCLSAFMANCPSHVQGRPILPECTRRHRSVYVIACLPDVSSDAFGAPGHPSRWCKPRRRFNLPGGLHVRPACQVHLPERWLDRARRHSPAWLTQARQARRRHPRLRPPDRAPGG